eukprot:COSAG06_NODE_3025_length_5945_cov_88.882826_3_plen_33_part_01
MKWVDMSDEQQIVADTSHVEVLSVSKGDRVKVF